MSSQKIKVDLNEFAEDSGVSKDVILALSGRNQPRSKSSRLEKAQLIVNDLRENVQTQKKANKAENINKKAKQEPIVVEPTSALQFCQMFKAYLICECKQTVNQTLSQWIDQNKECLYQMLKNSLQQGGIIKIIAQGGLETFFTKFIKPLNVTSAKQAFDNYKKYLFKYEHYIARDSFKTNYNLQSLFNSASFISQTQLSSFLKESPLNLKYYQDDILVFQNGQESLSINHETISLDNVAEKYQDFIVDIRIQKPMDYGFNVNKLRNQPYQMKLSDFRKYQKICQENPGLSFKQHHQMLKSLGPLQNISVNGIKFSQRLKKGEIFFAVNFDPSDGLLIQHVQQHVKNTFLGYKQSFDLLSYLDHQVPGCSLPQFYFKVKGVWTGGHQENINMCAVNINHGPDSSQWYTMHIDDVEVFRKTLKQKFKIDLYSQQGLWYEKVNWFMQNGFPIKKIIQKKGDIVISGPGTLHWVRSYGIALQSAWNVFPTTYHQFKCAFNRHAENKIIKFVKSNTIPLKSLILKYLNHQSQLMDHNIKALLIQKVQEWCNQQQKVLEQIKQSYQISQFMKFQKLQDLQSFCEVCRQQVLIYFVDGVQTGIMCIQCYKLNSKIKKQASQKIYQKHYHSSILSLLNLCKKNKNFCQLPQFCNGPYVGKHTHCKLNNRQCKSDDLKQQQKRTTNLNVQTNLLKSIKILQQSISTQDLAIKKIQILIPEADLLIQDHNFIKIDQKQISQKFRYDIIHQTQIQQNKEEHQDKKGIILPQQQNKQLLQVQKIDNYKIKEDSSKLSSDILQKKRQRNSSHQRQYRNSPTFSSDSKQQLNQTRGKSIKPKQKSQIQSDKIKKKHHFESENCEERQKQRNKKKIKANQSSSSQSSSQKARRQNNSHYKNDRQYGSSRQKSTGQKHYEGKQKNLSYDKKYQRDRYHSNYNNYNDNNYYKTGRFREEKSQYRENENREDRRYNENYRGYGRDRWHTDNRGYQGNRGYRGQRDQRGRGWQTYHGNHYQKNDYNQRDKIPQNYQRQNRRDYNHQNYSNEETPNYQRYERRDYRNNHYENKNYRQNNEQKQFKRESQDRSQKQEKQATFQYDY